MVVGGGEGLQDGGGGGDKRGCRVASVGLHLSGCDHSGETGLGGVVEALLSGELWEICPRPSNTSSPS